MLEGPARYGVNEGIRKQYLKEPKVTLSNGRFSLKFGVVFFVLLALLVCRPTDSVSVIILEPRDGEIMFETSNVLVVVGVFHEVNGPSFKGGQIQLRINETEIGMITSRESAGLEELLAHVQLRNGKWVVSAHVGEEGKRLG